MIWTARAKRFYKVEILRAGREIILTHAEREFVLDEDPIDLHRTTPISTIHSFGHRSEVCYHESMDGKDISSNTPKRIYRELLFERRKEAIELYNHGWSQYQVAKHMGVSYEAVSNWVEQYKKGGINSLNSLGRPGPKKGNKNIIKNKDIPIPIPVPIPPKNI